MSPLQKAFGGGLIAALLCGASPIRAEVATPLLDADPFTAEVALTHGVRNAQLRRYLSGVTAAARREDAPAIRILSALGHARGTDPAMARRALETAGTTALRAGRYAEAADLLKEALTRDGRRMTPRDRQDLQQTLAVAAALRAEPPPVVEGLAPATLPLAQSPLGLTTVESRINGEQQTAVVDTGANLSTLSESAARRLRVQFVGGDGHVASAVTGAVSSRMAIADEVRLGPVTLRHVAFIVLSDAALSPAGPERRIDAILGFPVLSALGRISLSERAAADGSVARELSIAPTPPRDGPGNLRFAGFDAWVRAGVDGEPLPLMLDSGATHSALSRRYARERAAKLAQTPRKAATVGGAGGVEIRQTAVLPRLRLSVADTTLPLSDVPVELDGNGADKTYGVIGADVLWARGGYTLDFRNLSLTLGGAPRPVAACPAAQHTHDAAGVLQAEREWLTAVLQADVPAMACLLDDAYVDLTAAGQVRTKADLLARARTRAPHPGPLPVIPWTVMVRGEAATAYATQLRTGPAGKPIKTIAADSFAYRDGRWRPYLSVSAVATAP